MDNYESLMSEIRKILLKQTETIQCAMEAQSKAICDVLQEHLRCSTVNEQEAVGSGTNAKPEVNYPLRSYVPQLISGALLSPKVLVRVERSEVLPNGRCRITTSRTTKGYFRGVAPLNGEVPRHWIRDTVISDALLPFVVDEQRLAQFIIPIESESALKIANDPSKETYWQEASRLYIEKESSSVRKARPTLMDSINTGDKIRAILSGIRSKEHVVLFSAVAHDMSASLVPCRMILSGVGLFEVSSRVEGEYLATILNSDYLSAFFSLRNEKTNRRTRKMFESLRIPLYDEADARHKRLAQLYRTASHVVKRSGLDRPKNILMELRSQGVMNQIDDIVRGIVPNAAMK